MQAFFASGLGLQGSCHYYARPAEPLPLPSVAVLSSTLCQLRIQPPFFSVSTLHFKERFILIDIQTKFDYQTLIRFQSVRLVSVCVKWDCRSFSPLFYIGLQKIAVQFQL